MLILSIKKAAKIFLACFIIFGVTFFVTIIAHALFLSNYDLDGDVFSALLNRGVRETYATVSPYFITFICAAIWFGKDIATNLRQKLNYLAKYYDTVKNEEESIKALNKLIEIDPINYLNNLSLIYFYIKIKKVPIAILALRKLLTLYPNDGKSLFLLSHLYMFQGKIERTKQMLKRQKISSLQRVIYKNIEELKHSWYLMFSYDPFPYESDKDWFFSDDFPF